MRSSSYPSFRHLLRFCILSSCAAVSLFRADAANQARVSGVDGGMPYWLHVPADAAANPSKRYATIIYLHGWGNQCSPGSYGTTSELSKIANHGPQQYTVNSSQFGFLVNGQMEYYVLITPQIKDGKSWNAADIVALLDEVKGIAPVDENRVYLTGFSFGGEGTWNVLVEAANQPNRFAAAAPVHGRAESPVRNNMQIIADHHVPVWYFAGTEDTSEHNMYYMLLSGQRLLEKYPTAEVRAAVGEGVGHSSTRAYSSGTGYNNPNLYQWFLTKTLPQYSPTVFNNLAATASVTAGDAVSGQPASRVKDGKLNTYWSSTSADPTVTWIEYDLQEIRSVNQFLINNASTSNLRALKPTPASGTVTAFADAGGGLTTVTASGHGFQNGESALLVNNPSYNGLYVVSARTTNTFQITKTFAGTGTAGWQVPAYVTKSYTIQVRSDASAPWTTLVTETNNYEFVRQHIIPPTSMRYVRLSIEKGSRMTLANECRIFEFQVLESLAPVDPPAPPANLQVTGTTSGGATLQWQDASDNESVFRVYWSTSAVKPASPNATAVADATSYNVSGLQAGTTYHFWVSAYNEGGESAAATASAQTLPPSLPAAPTGLAASGIGSNGMSLQWNDAADNETAYRVYWNTTSVKPATPGASLAAGATSHNVSGLQPETMYFFWITASNIAGESLAATTSAATLPTLGSIDTGLISHWKMDEATGTAAIDSTGLQDGTLRGNAAWLPDGHLGGAVQFDGTNDWVEMPNRSEYGGNALSVSLWLKPQVLGGQPRGIVSKRTGTSQSQRCFSIFTSDTTNKVTVDIGAVRVDTQYQLAEGNTWRQMVVTYDGTLASNNVKLYMDGVLITTKTAAVATLPTLNSPLCIGILNADYGMSFLGGIDNVRLHNRVLTQAEVTFLFDEIALPAAPTGMATTGIGSSEMTLQWNDVADNETAYKVYWNTTNVKPASPGAILAAGATSHSVSGLQPETMYFFWVTASNITGESPAATTSAATLPALGSIGEGLISHWKMDETTGTAAIDSTGFQNGTLGGDAAWLPDGHLGGAVQFDGTNDWVEMPNRPEYGGNALSVSLWLKPQVLGGQPRGIVSKRTGTSQSQRCFSIFTSDTANKVTVDVGTVRVDTQYALAEGSAWRHMVVTYDGTLASNNVKLYMDGLLITTKTAAVATLPTLISPFYIGILNAGYGVSTQGGIDNVRIHNRVLTQAEVTILFGETDPEPPAQSFASWAPPELSGETVPAPPPASYGAWAAPELAGVPAALRDEQDDPDDDGIANLMEFFLQLSPTVPDAEGLPISSLVEEGGERYFEFTYVRRQDAIEAGLTYQVEVSRNMVDWATEEEGVPLTQEMEVADNGDGTETVRVRYIYPASTDPAVFMRLHVEASDP